MEHTQQHLLKVRDLGFSELHPDPRQAESAAEILRRVPGVVSVQPVGPYSLRLRYDLAQTCLRLVEETLANRGFHLDGNLLAKLRRAIVYYAEDTLRANLGCPRGSSNCTQKVFVDRYRHLDHSCRDHRPTHWRQYL
jgi:hypothetical protein